ncbi:hypothetical protein CMUS01_15130 [Colletotrichum musicola]|uniref:Uncharacterized protein n=1 Tax=Colletotrichum musicola TaxID=2175873 RepID=A0A8H6IYL0_9PEZI|nr:hypothetical protein CMUS01_15130 [Colletotrichum musicola]
MAHDHNNQGPRKSKSKGGRRGESNGSSSHTASSSSSARRTSHHSASSSSSRRQSSSHGSARGSSATNPRDYQYNAGAQIDFSSQIAEQGSRSAEDERWYRQEYARTHPGVAFPHDQPRYGNHYNEINNAYVVSSSQGHQAQESDWRYARDLDIESDDASNQDNPPYPGDRRW